MTAALIAVIAFLILWGFQAADKKEQKRLYKEKTKTNLTLERKLISSWIEQLSTELNIVDDAAESIYDCICKLYKKYHIPLFTFIPLDDNVKRQTYYAEQKSLSDAREQELQAHDLLTYKIISQLSRKDLDQSAASPVYSEKEQDKIYAKYFSGLKIFEKHLSQFQLKKNTLWLETEYKLAYTASYHNLQPLPEKPPQQLYSKYKTLAERIKQNDIAQNFYNQLILNLTRRSLYCFNCFHC